MAHARHHTSTCFCRLSPNMPTLSPTGCNPLACSSTTTRRSSCGVQRSVANIVYRPIGTFNCDPSSTVHNLVSTLTRTSQCRAMSGGLFRDVSPYYVSCVPSGSIHGIIYTTCGIPVAACPTGPFTTGLLQQCSVCTACIPHPPSPIYSECCCAAHLRNPPVRAHHRRAHQPTLAARS